MRGKGQLIYQFSFSKTSLSKEHNASNGLMGLLLFIRIIHPDRFSMIGVQDRKPPEMPELRQSGRARNDIL